MMKLYLGMIRMKKSPLAGKKPKLKHRYGDTRTIYMILIKSVLQTNDFYCKYNTNN